MKIDQQTNVELGREKGKKGKIPYFMKENIILLKDII